MTPEQTNKIQHSCQGGLSKKRLRPTSYPKVNTLAYTWVWTRWYHTQSTKHNLRKNRYHALIPWHSTVVIVLSPMQAMLFWRWGWRGRWKQRLQEECTGLPTCCTCPDVSYTDSRWCARGEIDTATALKLTFYPRELAIIEGQKVRLSLCFFGMLILSSCSGKVDTISAKLVWNTNGHKIDWQMEKH